MSDDEREGARAEAENAFVRAVNRNAALDRALGGKGWLAEDATNIDLGKNILLEEIGHFGAGSGPHYHLSQETRDLLLAHGRQDAAAAFAMARSAFREAHFARRASERLAWLLAVSLVLNVAVLARIWWG
jgi:hypothetical protein